MVLVVPPGTSGMRRASVDSESNSCAFFCFLALRSLKEHLLALAF